MTGYPHDSSPAGADYQPPPRRGAPWWAWLLGGCAGCVVLGGIVAGVLIALGYGFVSGVVKEVGPVNQTTVQQALGDVPLYPNGTLQTQETQVTLTTLRVVEKAAGRPAGSIFRCLAVQSTPDTEDEVFQFYEETLKKGGWSRAESGGADPSQRIYRHERDHLMLQVQDAPGGNRMIWVWRGGEEMLEKLPPESGPPGKR